MFEDFNKFCVDLELDIAKAYESSATLDEAEKLAAKFLLGMIRVGNQLQRVNLDARMRKAGVKAIRAAVYLNEARATDKKPSDTLLEQVVNSSKEVRDAQNSMDTAEVESNRLDSLLQVCREAHVYFRGISKGRFE